MQINAHFNPAARLRALIRRRARRKVGRRNACSVDTVSSRRGILVANDLVVRRQGRDPCRTRGFYGAR